jgi:hypothetical protein
MARPKKGSQNIAFDFTKLAETTLDQYLVVRNGFGSGLSTIVGLSASEANELGLDFKKGWYQKHKQTKFPTDKIRALVKRLTDVQWLPEDAKRRLVSAYIGTEES